MMVKGALNKKRSPNETFQLIRGVDLQLGGGADANNVPFDEQAHHAKRELLLARAAEAKRRIDQQNQIVTSE